MADAQKENAILKSSVSVSSLMLFSDPVFPYGMKVSSSYTGASKVVCARTTWELNALVANEQNRQRAEEIRKHALEIAGDERVAAQEMTKQLQNARKEYNEIISHTLAIDDRLDWDKQFVRQTYKDFIYPPPPEREVLPEKTGIGKLFGNSKEQAKLDEEHQQALSRYKQQKITAIREYLINKEKSEKNRRVHNAEIRYLRKCFEAGEASAIEKYANIVLANSQYPSELEMEHEIAYNCYTETMTVNFLFQCLADFPLIEEYRYSQTAQCIKECRMSPEAANKFYEKVLLSVALRTIHELYEAIYIDKVDEIIFNGFVLNSGKIDENISAGIAPGGKMRCVFSVRARRSEFEGVELDDDGAEEILKRFGLVRVKNSFSDITELIKPLSKEE